MQHGLERQARRVNPEQSRQGRAPPQQSIFAMTWDEKAPVARLILRQCVGEGCPNRCKAQCSYCMCKYCCARASQDFGIVCHAHAGDSHPRLRTRQRFPLRPRQFRDPRWSPNSKIIRWMSSHPGFPDTLEHILSCGNSSPSTSTSHSLSSSAPSSPTQTQEHQHDARMLQAHSHEHHINHRRSPSDLAVARKNHESAVGQKVRPCFPWP